MKIKTYHSESVPKALAQIKKDLGPRAMILSTRKTRKRKFFGLVPTLFYEITAASEASVSEEKEVTPAASRPARRRLETYETAPEPVVSERQVPSPARAKAAGGVAASSGTAAASLSPQIVRLSEELREMKRLLTFQSKGGVDAVSLFPDQFSRELFEELRRQGLDERVASTLLMDARRGGGIHDSAALETEFSERLQSLLTTAPIDTTQNARASIFLGPTGVGKTTTIAKLASHFALGDRRPVRLVTLDTYRIAAAEQLKIYAEIIRVPIDVVSSVTQLHDTIQESDPEEYILIDTTGHSHRDLSCMRDLATFLLSRQDIEKHLVLSCTTKSEDLFEMINGFEIFGPDKLVFTKLDETSSYGTIVNQLIRTGKPLSYLTNGQKVPQDLLTPDAESVARLLVPKSELVPA